MTIRLVYPLPGAPVTGGFGWRVIDGKDNFHTGTDIGAQSGTPIGAAGPGRVAHIGWDPTGYGHYVDLDHGEGVKTRYAHMIDRSPLVVSEQVSAGKPVGRVGSTGWSTGPHLHLEVRINGAAVDPLPHITAAQQEEEDMKGIIYRAENYKAPNGVYAGPTGGFVVLANGEERANLVDIGTPEVWLTAKTLDELIKDARKTRG